MLIGLPREIKDGEFRVALTPGGVGDLAGAGHEVVVERGAGLGVGFWLDTAYAGDLLQSGSQAFTPQHDPAWRRSALGRWRHAVETVKQHYRGPLGHV